jgi:hypothetical protein
MQLTALSHASLFNHLVIDVKYDEIMHDLTSREHKQHFSRFARTLSTKSAAHCRR